LGGKFNEKRGEEFAHTTFARQAYAGCDVDITILAETAVLHERLHIRGYILP
jgi:hypothetical protein